MHMGYKAKLKTYLIRFDEGHEHHGAEARLRGISYAEWEEMAGLDGGDGDNNAAKSIHRFADHLVSWNLEDPDTGEPLPPTMESIKKIDKDLIKDLSNAWIQHLIGVHDADPLPASSPSGGPSPEVSAIPMAALSPSLAS